MDREFTIGVLGGMGTYATIHLFKQYAAVFPAEKEWERPRILIDNRCTMPSRVRAYLYGENTNQLVQEMTDSLKLLLDAGCSRILLACNTSHLFLPMIEEKLPELENRLVNICRVCADRLAKDGIRETYLLGTEGTIESGIYQKELALRGIRCDAPGPEEYRRIRECIEAVKRNRFDEKIRSCFLELINRRGTCILGCTELPVLYERYREEVTCGAVYDPVLTALALIREEWSRGRETA